MHAAAGEKFIAVFLGSKIPPNNQSWCPHCVQAMPSIERVMKAAKGKRLVMVGNVSMNAWKGAGSKNHKYRLEPYNVRGVPTMILFEGKEQIHRVDTLS